MGVSHLLFCGLQHKEVYRDGVGYACFFYCFGMSLNAAYTVRSRTSSYKFVVSVIRHYISSI